MYGKALRRALAVVVLFTLGASASCYLPTSDPLIRSYGWNSLAWLGLADPHTGSINRGRRPCADTL